MKRQKESGRKCYKQGFFCHFKTWPKCIGMSFFVCDPWTTELHEMNANCFQMLKSLFSHAFMVFESHQFHPPLPVRENCPVLLWRNSQTIDSDIRFGVCLWQSLKIRRDIFLTLNGIEWRLKIWFLMAKYTHWYQKRKQCQNSIVRDENACFPVYWNCLKIFLHVSWTV